MNLERELQDALARKQPDDGFAARVMKRRANFSSPGSSGRTEVRPTSWLRIAASITLFALLGGGHAAHHARQQALLALHIASSKARLAQREVMKGTP